MATQVASFQVRVEQVEGYEFRIRFDKPMHADLIIDEPQPLGDDSGPNPARVLAAAIGSCLSASLVYCMSRARISVEGITSDVSVELVRNERQRLRIGKVAVELHPEVRDAAALCSCLDVFEDFCVVTQSVREGIDVEVKVEPRASETAAPASRRGDVVEVA